MDITFAICSDADGVRIVNAATEADAYQILYNEPFPEEDLLPIPANSLESLEWDCTIITLRHGEMIDPSRYM